MLNSRQVRTTYGFVWEAVLELKGELETLNAYLNDGDSILHRDLAIDTRDSIMRAIDSLENSLSQF